MQRTLRVYVALITVLTLFGCSSSGTSCVGTPFAPQPPPVLVYPASGATGVPDGLSQIVIAAFAQTGTGVQALSLRTDDQPNLVGLPVPSAPPSPVPSPAATYPPRDTLFGVALPRLAPQTKYTVNYASVPGPGCGPIPANVEIVPIGSFTTK